MTAFRGKRNQVLTVILILVTIFIWGNSMLPPDASWRLSEWIRGLLGWVFTDVGAGGSGGNWGVLVRKLAHYTEFLVFGALARLRFKHLPTLWLPLLMGLLTALVDESIQYYSGRTSSVFDVWLDFAGVASGVLIIELPGFWKRAQKNVCLRKK